MPPGGAISAGRAQPMTPRFIDQPEHIEQEGAKLEALPGDLLLTRPMMKPRLIKGASDRTREFSRRVLKNLPQQTSLARDQELDINRRHFTADIEALQKQLGVDLSHWLG